MVAWGFVVGGRGIGVGAIGSVGGGDGGRGGGYCAVRGGASVQKGIARAVYDTIKAGADGKFDKKPYVGTLKNGGVSLAPFHDFEGSLPAGLTGELDAIKKEIVEGKTVVTSKSAFDAKGGSGK